MAGYWLKFSTSNNRTSGGLHWLRYCHCAKITKLCHFYHIPCRRCQKQLGIICAHAGESNEFAHCQKVQHAFGLGLHSSVTFDTFDKAAGAGTLGRLLEGGFRTVAVAQTN